MSIYSRYRFVENEHTMYVFIRWELVLGYTFQIKIAEEQ